MMDNNYQVYFLEKWYEHILGGRKTQTMRLPVSRWEVKEEDIVTANFKGKSEKILLEIRKVGYKSFRSINDDDAKLSGYSNVAELKNALREIYQMPIEDWNRVYFYQYDVVGTIENVKGEDIK